MPEHTDEEKELRKLRRLVEKIIGPALDHFESETDPGWPDNTELLIQRADPEDMDFTLGDLRKLRAALAALRRLSPAPQAGQVTEAINLPAWEELSVAVRTDMLNRAYRDLTENQQHPDIVGYYEGIRAALSLGNFPNPHSKDESDG